MSGTFRHPEPGTPAVPSGRPEPGTPAVPFGRPEPGTPAVSSGRPGPGTPAVLQPIGRCRVMGVVNVTPDSFSDGGHWIDPQTAVEHGLELIERGADLVDVGGESTRPGAVRIDVEEELARVLPVVRGLAGQGVDVSVDTMRARVAAESLDAGAAVVNDVSGGRADPQMVPLVARTAAPVVLMHWRGHSDRMQDLTQYGDVVTDVVAELREQVQRALEAGVAPERIVVDPGLGFSKTGEQNWSVLADLPAFMELGHPLLVAASRKRFLGELLAGVPGSGRPDGTAGVPGSGRPDGTAGVPDSGRHGGLATADGDGNRPVDDREDATAAITTLAAAAGAWCVRVHDPRPSADAVRVVARLAWEKGGSADE
ncbi:dihydropteroate synthase [Aeromicrobium sp. CTD01-1L150]|uniref:dihydropteroate synthase n=1 Tax=Aeromicrobium sp. CTD01-1L150 TaxID=3341830 RepID=UPI0035BEE98D